MKKIILILVLFTSSLISNSQTFKITKFTHLLGEGIVNDRYLTDSWIKIEENTVTTHVSKNDGSISENEWVVVEWDEHSNSTNKSLELNESLVLLAKDGSKIGFYYQNRTSWNGMVSPCLTIYQPYTGARFVYNLEDK